MNRANNDIRNWLDEGGARLLKGENGVDVWKNDPDTVARVRELYKPSSVMREKMENDRRQFLNAMAQVKEGMVLGVDKNPYVEPTLWTYRMGSEVLQVSYCEIELTRLLSLLGLPRFLHAQEVQAYLALVSFGYKSMRKVFLMVAATLPSPLTAAQ